MGLTQRERKEGNGQGEDCTARQHNRDLSSGGEWAL